jgi:hypothetical protein
MFSVLKSIRKSGDAYRSNFYTIIIASILMSLPVTILVGLGSMYLFGLSSMEDGSLQDRYNSIIYDPDISERYGQDAMEGQLEGNVWLFLILSLSGMLLLAYLSAGFYGVCLLSHKGKTNISVFFTQVRQNGITMAVYFTSLLVGLSIYLVILEFASGIAVIQLALLAAALAAAPLLLLASPAIVSGRSVVGAIKESIFLGKKAYLKMWGVVIFAFILQLISVMVLFVSPIVSNFFALLFATPLIALVQCSAYLDLLKENRGPLKRLEFLGKKASSVKKAAKKAAKRA